MQCLSPCATCIDKADNCLSCVSGRSLKGSNCRKNDYLYITLLFGQKTNGSIFSDSSDGELQLFQLLINMNRLGSALDDNFPIKFKDGRNWP